MMKPQNPWPTFPVGKLRHQIQIQQQSSTQDGFGQPLISWTTVRSTSAGKDLVSMREAFGSNQLTSHVTDIWTVRWSAGIEPGMRISWGSKSYKLQAINDVEGRNLWLHLLCLELNAAS